MMATAALNASLPRRAAPAQIATGKEIGDDSLPLFCHKWLRRTCGKLWNGAIRLVLVSPERMNISVSWVIA